MALVKRPPVISVMGHVDHGKSTILDYIRKTNVVAKEAGGITQHVSAYEVEHEYEGEKRKITFLDTPGHEAFKEIRRRGASVADIAILVVAADDSVKQQTLDALEAIKDAQIPFVVAINKIDLPNANIQKVQSDLIEHGIYIEGMGGDIPWVAVSAKTGEGINDLLDTLILVADLQDLQADPNAKAKGVIIETKKDTKRGISATLIIKDGTLHAGEFVLAEDAWSPVRIFEDFMGNPIKEASFSSPVKVTGFNKLPEVGVMFEAVSSKKEAEDRAEEAEEQNKNRKQILSINKEDKFAIPVVVLADTVGSKEAIIYELTKLETEKAYFKILHAAVGDVTKDDVEMALAGEAIVLAFNVKTDKVAKEFARSRGVIIENFNIIYKLTDFAQQYLNEKSPKVYLDKEIGQARILKVFSESKKGAVVGGKVEKGIMRKGAKVKLIRRGVELAEGIIVNLQSNKQDVDKVEEGALYGAQLDIQVPLTENDLLSVIEKVEQ